MHMATYAERNDSASIQTTRRNRIIVVTPSLSLAVARASCFNPRAPCGARHKSLLAKQLDDEFQSTRPVRGATLRYAEGARPESVSIHAPRAGRDGRVRYACLCRSVSIHAPRAGRDFIGLTCNRNERVSIHAPRAGRDPGYRVDFHMQCVSIHAPRAGRDAAYRAATLTV